MFWDSTVLKDDLVADIENVEARLRDASEGEMESALIAVEQFVFWAAFAVRKLADSYKLSDEFESTSWEIHVYPKRASTPAVDFLNWHRLDRHYDFAAQSRSRLKLRQLCGFLVHSFVFMPETTDDGRTLTGLLFNSDRTKDVAIYRISWDEFCKLIQSLAIDDIVEFSYNRITGAMVKRGTKTASHASSF
jgi:hypothetical protein